MKPQSIRRSRAALIALGGIAIAISMIPAVHADEWNKKTVLTIDQPMQVRNTYLEPGSYVFKLLNSPSDRNVVQIFNRDETHIIGTVLAVPNYRLQPTGKSRFMQWETPAGSVAALRAWFYPGDNFGQEFPYPKHLRQIAVNTPPPPPPSFNVAPPAAAVEPAPAPAAVEVPQAEAAPAPEPVEVAQNNPPPAPAPAPAPAELPKTASPYPLIGLGGFLSLAIGAMLRTKQTA